MRKFAILLLLVGMSEVAAETRDERHEKLRFLVGVWNTEHAIPSREGEPTIVRGEATIEWVLGASWLRHEFHADFPGRGDVFVSNMMNYSPDREMYNFYMFDHFGGEAGAFYGDWVAENAIELKASFDETDGRRTHQKVTLTRVSENEIWVSRAFSDDGEHYHFELKGVYTRRQDR